MSARRCDVVLGAGGLLAALGCRSDPAPDPRATTAALEAPPPPWQAEARPAAPPRGMVRIPGGTLIAGTPEGQVPRLPDREMAGEEVELHGFFMDIFAYPNEEGAIAMTGVTFERAEALCAERDKRLCTELEWERACKGPSNTTYEYGDQHRPEVCLTGRASRLLPSGFRQGCQSEFGVRDLHGSVWEWTASRYGRGQPATMVTVRGGNGEPGELVGRCANAEPRAAGSASPGLGFRCCQGEPNEATVRLNLKRSTPLEPRPAFDATLASKLDALVPESEMEGLAAGEQFRTAALWDYRPVVNAAYVVGGGCAGPARGRRCGAVVAELVAGEPRFATWLPSGLWPPLPRVYSDSRKLWVYGGDRTSQLRRPAFFEWGRFRHGELERKLTEGGEWAVRRRDARPPQGAPP